MNSACRLLFALVLASPFPAFAQTAAPTAPAASASETGVLSAAATEKLLPASVLFKGQIAPVQTRNSGAIRQADGSLIIASMVDSSGYSSGIRERYQFFFYTELPLPLGAHTLAPGFYGAGFIADNTMVVLTVDGHDLFTAPTTTDPSLKRPRPLQILAGSGRGEYRLYLGRSYITLKPSTR